MNRKNLYRLAGFSAAALLAANAWSEPDRKSGADSEKGDPLSGPRVEDRAVPGVDNQFGEGRRGRMGGNERIAHRRFMGAVRSLEIAEVSEELRLSDTQREEIRDIAEEFRVAMQAFRDEHADELKELREKAAPAARERRERGRRAEGAPPQRERGPRPDAERRTPQERDPNMAGGNGGGKPQAPPENPELREQMAELMKDAPKPEEYHTRIWAVLNDAQQAAVRERLDRMKEEGARGDRPRGDRVREREGREKGAERARPGRGQGRAPRNDL